MELVVYTDGGSIGNPGPSASAFVVYQDGEVVLKKSEKIGFSTNNRAEYQAVVNALEEIKKRFKNIRKILFYSDSRLLVNQLNGVFKVKDGVIRELIMKIRVLETETGAECFYYNIPREKNTVADSLVKERFF